MGISVFVEGQFPSFLAPVASVRASWALRLHRPSTLTPSSLDTAPFSPPEALSWPPLSFHLPATQRAHTQDPGLGPSSSSPKPCHHLNLLFSSLLQVISCRSFPRILSSTPLDLLLQLFSLFAPSRRFDRSLLITHDGPPNSCDRALHADALSTSPDTSALEKENYSFVSFGRHLVVLECPGNSQRVALSWRGVSLLLEARLSPTRWSRRLDRRRIRSIATRDSTQAPGFHIFWAR